MYLTVLRKNIHYNIRGSGTPILFIHGWGGTMESLTPLSLLFDTYQTITLDLPGFGKSDLPDPSWGIKEYVRIIVELCKKLNINKVICFGHSFGGSLGIYIASHMPTLINKLILCSSSFKRSNTSKSNKLFKYIPKPIKKIVYRIFFPNSDSMKYPSLESNFRKIISEDLTSCLSSIHTPTLILWGEQDRDTPVSLAYELNEKITGSQLITFQNMTHGLPIKYPNRVYQKIVDFL